MPPEIEKVYRFAPLDAYPLKKRLFIRVADLGFYVLIKLIGSTVRFSLEGQENLRAIESAGKVPIYVFWHDRIFLGSYYFRNRGIVVLTSQSFDGEYIARFIQRLGFGAIRGSSTRGGTKALVEMIRCMRRGIPMGFTADGPKGPRYEAKPGPALLAKKTGNPILPFMVANSRYFTINSWDRLQIPFPFSRANVILGEPIFISADAGEEELESGRIRLQEKLDELVERGEQWRESITRESSHAASAGRDPGDL